MSLGKRHYNTCIRKTVNKMRAAVLVEMFAGVCPLSVRTDKQCQGKNKVLANDLNPHAMIQINTKNNCVAKHV